MERSPRPITQRLMNRHDLFQMGYVSALMAIFRLNWIRMVHPGWCKRNKRHNNDGKHNCYQ